jgi:polyhydroxyalkanoate synthesis regulator phasin
MVREALTNYLSLASGLTDVTRQRAREVAKALAAQGEATREQVSGIAEEILTTSRANRHSLVNLVHFEVDRAFARLGLATGDEVAALHKRITDLEAQVKTLTAAKSATAPKPAKAPARTATKTATKSTTKTATKSATKTAAKAAPKKKAAAKATGPGTR